MVLFSAAWRAVPLAAASALLCACSDFAPARLADDQIGYSRSLNESLKAQTLLNIIRIRYGDSPVFLNTTQVISAYSLQQNVSGSFQILPGNAIADFFGASAGGQMQQSPTFTFQPVTGEALAQSYIRPLAPAELFSLGLSGLPIDVLFRLAVQSVNGLYNTTMLDDDRRAESSGFAQLLVNLRRLQLAQLLSVRLDTAGDTGSEKNKVGGQLIPSIADSDVPALEATVAATRRMLAMPQNAGQVEVVYGQGHPGPGQIAILTRPVLGVLSEAASELEVAPEDVAAGLTVPTIGSNPILHRQTVIIHSGAKAPEDAFVQAQYRGRWYWIAFNDFDSKLAFTVIQLLHTIAQTDMPASTVLTIPAH